MSPNASRQRVAFGRRGAAALLVFLTAVCTGPTQAIERYLVPDESSSGPFYARIEHGFVHMTDHWVAVAFYRQPACVRPSFNLLNFFDFANIPAIFGCPLTVSGFEIWKSGVATDPAPMQSKLQGNGAVPVWFVSVADFSAALPGLTLTELSAMPSLTRGYAVFFEETLHPAGAARQTMLHISARGWLEDGRSFFYEATEAGGEMKSVRIDFR
ncbi:MAG TPA: hypothetical protein VFI92_12255 [Steroidobacteraceae bacterium]|nr:hypothetical protein [Steroidobacteraceae bacterium]